MSIYATIIAEIDSGVAAPAEGRTGYNGHIACVDLSKPVDTISEKYKIVTCTGGGLDHFRCVAFAIFCEQGCPSKATKITAEHLQNVMPRLGHIMAIHTILVTLHAAGVNVTYRTSDCLTTAQFESIDGHEALLDASLRLIEALRNDEGFLAKQLSESKFVLLCAIANAIHREQCEGHNWYTNNGRIKGTTTSRTLAVAGEHAQEFSNFMSIHGHDLWHFASDKSLYGMAGVMCGYKSAVIARNFTYNGTEVKGWTIQEVFAIGDAATDRFPPGIMGKGSMMVGLGMLGSMLTAISMKVVVDGIGKLLNAIEELKIEVASINDRSELLNKKNELSKVCVIAYGFFCADPANQGTLTDARALSALAARDLSAKSMGASMYTYLNGVESDPQAIASTFAALLETVKESVGGSAEDFVIPAINVPLSLTQSIMRKMVENGGNMAGPAVAALQSNSDVKLEAKPKPAAVVSDAGAAEEAEANDSAAAEPEEKEEVIDTAVTRKGSGKKGSKSSGGLSAKRRGSRK